MESPSTSAMRCSALSARDRGATNNSCGDPVVREIALNEQRTTLVERSQFDADDRGEQTRNAKSTGNNPRSRDARSNRRRSILADEVNELPEPGRAEDALYRDDQGNEHHDR